MFYMCLGTATLLLIRWWREHLGTGHAPEGLDGLDPVQLGYIAGGTRRAADTVLVGMFEAGAIQRYGKAARFEATGRMDQLPGPIRPYAMPLSGAVQRGRVHQRARHIAPLVHDDLAARGLVPPMAEIWNFRLFATMLLTIPLLLGAAKVMVGVHRGHPVAYLVLLIVLLFALGLGVITKGPYRTKGGSAAISRLRRQAARATRAPLRDEILLAFALTGTAALAGRTYKSFFTSSSAAFGSGCSGSGGCGGGGGGGGGGCGGCS